MKKGLIFSLFVALGLTTLVFAQPGPPPGGGQTEPITTLNIAVNAFRIAEGQSLPVTNMLNGVVDAYVDDSGVNLATSTNTSLADINTFLLLHLDGADGQTTTVDESDSSHAVTFEVTAQIDTSESVFGGASLLLDGDSDYLRIPDSPDWDLFSSATTDITIEFFVKHDNHTGEEAYVAHYQDASNLWLISNRDGTDMIFVLKVDGSNSILFSGTEITDSNTHHVALIKVGDEYGLYLDGVQGGFVQDSSVANFTGNLHIGARTDPVNLNYLDGNIDEVRIIQSNPFNASPNSGLTDTITVPTTPHVPTSGTFYSPDPGTNMILTSNVFDSQIANPGRASIVLFEEEAGVSDLVVSVSKDAGATPNMVTLVDRGEYEAGRNMLTATVNLAGSTGNQMQYRIETLNNVSVKIHGVGLFWE